MANGMRQILFVLLPAAAAVLVLSEPMIRLVYQRGEFTPEQTDPGRHRALLVRLLAADQRPLPAADPHLLQPAAALDGDRPGRRSTWSSPPLGALAPLQALRHRRDRRRHRHRHDRRGRRPGGDPAPRVRRARAGPAARHRRSGSRSPRRRWPRSASASGTCSTTRSGAASSARSSRSASASGSAASPTSAMAKLLQHRRAGADHAACCGGARCSGAGALPAGRRRAGAARRLCLAGGGGACAGGWCRELDGLAGASGDRGARDRWAPALDRRAARHASAGSSRCRISLPWSLLGWALALRRGDGEGVPPLAGFFAWELGAAASAAGRKRGRRCAGGTPAVPRRRRWLPWRSPRSRSSISLPASKPRLSTGMTGFDSTWYHGPFAAGFFQSGDTWSLHFIAPQFLAWFYPANAEIFHGVGMLAFGRDLLSPLLNLGWFVGCLVACWCIGRPYRVAPWSLALGGDRAERAGALRSGRGGAQRHRRDLLPACRRCGCPECLGGRATEGGARAFDRGAGGRRAGGRPRRRDQAQLPPARGCARRRPGRDRAAGRRWRALAASGLAALAGGGYWYLRNLVHTGNPLPWIDHLGPITLPAPEQALGGREGHSVLGYLTDGSIWSDWFLPGLHHGSEPLLAAARRARPGGPRCSASAAAPIRCCGWPAWSASPPRSPGSSPRPPPPAPTACPAASSPASATWPRPWSSAWPCSHDAQLRDRLASLLAEFVVCHA